MSTPHNTGLWRDPASGVTRCWSKERGEGEREAIFVHRPSFEDGRHGDQPQFCWLMKARQSAAARTHTHTQTGTLTHLPLSQHLQTSQYCSTASVDKKLANQRPCLTHTSELEPIRTSFPMLHYTAHQSEELDSRCVWKIWANQEPDWDLNDFFFFCSLSLIKLIAITSPFSAFGCGGIVSAVSHVSPGWRITKRHLRWSETELENSGNEGITEEHTERRKRE